MLHNDKPSSKHPPDQHIQEHQKAYCGIGEAFSDLMHNKDYALMDDLRFAQFNKARRAKFMQYLDEQNIRKLVILFPSKASVQSLLRYTDMFDAAQWNDCTRILIGIGKDLDTLKPLSDELINSITDDVPGVPPLELSGKILSLDRLIEAGHSLQLLTDSVLQWLDGVKLCMTYAQLQRLTADDQQAFMRMTDTHSIFITDLKQCPLRHLPLDNIAKQCLGIDYRNILIQRPEGVSTFAVLYQEHKTITEPSPSFLTFSKESPIEGLQLVTHGGWRLVTSKIINWNALSRIPSRELQVQQNPIVQYGNTCCSTPYTWIKVSSDDKLSSCDSTSHSFNLLNRRLKEHADQLVIMTGHPSKDKLSEIEAPLRHRIYFCNDFPPYTLPAPFVDHFLDIPNPIQASRTLTLISYDNWMMQHTRDRALLTHIIIASVSCCWMVGVLLLSTPMSVAFLTVLAPELMYVLMGALLLIPVVARIYFRQHQRLPTISNCLIALLLAPIICYTFAVFPETVLVGMLVLAAAQIGITFKLQHAHQRSILAPAVCAVAMAVTMLILQPFALMWTSVMLIACAAILLTCLHAAYRRYSKILPIDEEHRGPQTAASSGSFIEPFNNTHASSTTLNNPKNQPPESEHSIILS